MKLLVDFLEPSKQNVKNLNEQELLDVFSSDNLGSFICMSR